MKINIAQKLDTSVLNITIAEMAKSDPNFSKSSYLIMNNETLESLENNECSSKYYELICPNAKVSPQYRGINIAVCDALDFGEIDIVRGYGC